MIKIKTINCINNPINISLLRSQAFSYSNHHLPVSPHCNTEMSLDNVIAQTSFLIVKRVRTSAGIGGDRITRLCVGNNYALTISGWIELADAVGGAGAPARLIESICVLSPIRKA